MAQAARSRLRGLIGGSTAAGSGGDRGDAGYTALPSGPLPSAGGGGGGSELLGSTPAVGGSGRPGQGSGIKAARAKYLARGSNSQGVLGPAAGAGGAGAGGAAAGRLSSVDVESVGS